MAKGNYPPLFKTGSPLTETAISSATLMGKGGTVEGASHKDGGVDFTVMGTKKKVELEGKEPVITSAAFSDPTIRTYNGTNKEILNEINRLYGGKPLSERVTSVGVSDVVICKRSAGDAEKKTLTGTPLEVVDQINQSGGCKPIGSSYHQERKQYENGGQFYWGYPFPNGVENIPESILVKWLIWSREYYLSEGMVPLFGSVDDFKNDPIKLSQAAFVSEIWCSMTEGCEFQGAEYLYKNGGEILHGGKADNLSTKKLARHAHVSEDKMRMLIRSGAMHESEHTGNKKIQAEIARDHLFENKNYYKELERLERNPVFGSGGKLNVESVPEESSDEELIKKFPPLPPKAVRRIYDRTMEILASSPTPESLTEEERYTLEQYEGLGSQVQTGKIDKGLLHQFYTPYILCKKMYELAAFYGVPNHGIKILEPSFGAGRFFKFAPENSEVYGFDPDKVNSQIVSLLYPKVTIYTKELETAFLEAPRYNRKAKKSWLPEMDLVIGNPPYGKYAGYYSSYMPKEFNRFEFLFIYLGLELLKPGGLLVYIVSQNILNNGAMYNGMKEKILKSATFVDSIRMPNGIFSTTEVGTDILILQKN